MDPESEMLSLRKSDLEQMERVYRLNFVNSLTGFKSANLIGTISLAGKSNLAIVSSVIHMSSSPAIVGFMQRPTSVPRDTYQNIKETRYYTINHVHKNFTDKAHYTSAKFPKEISEFDTSELTENYIENFPAPFVEESVIKMGISFIEEYKINASNTIMIVGQIEVISLPSKLVSDDGQIQIQDAGTVNISGLNNYHEAAIIASYPYARVDNWPINILKSK